MPWFGSHSHLPGLSSASSSTTNLASLGRGHRSPHSSAPPSRPGSPHLGMVPNGAVHPGLARASTGLVRDPSLHLSSGAGSGSSGGTPAILEPSARRIHNNAVIPDDPLAEIFNRSDPPSGIASAATTPAASTYSASTNGSYFPSPAYTPSLGGPSGSMTVGVSSQHPHHAHLAPLEIIIDSDELVLRGAGGDVNPALLSGQVVLNLTEKTNIRELTLRLEGKAKVAFMDGPGGAGSNKSHHYTHNVLTHDWSFLQGDRNHAHTLKAGRHAFPFSFTFEGNLPSSIRTYLNDGQIRYKLKASAVRSTFSTNFNAFKNISVVRSFTPDALEFNQTLEIENTWPGKIMYCLTLPHKAYAAGDEIPVSIKFMPLAKGTRVTHVSSVIKEYTVVHTRNSQHTQSRVAMSTKHEIRGGKAYRVTESGTEPVAPGHYERGEDAAAPSHSFAGMTSAPPSAPTSPAHRAVRDSLLGAVTPLHGLSRASSTVNLSNLVSPHSSMNASDRSRSEAAPMSRSNSQAPAEPSTSSVADMPDDMRDREDIEIGDEEVDTMITIPVPPWTTPSHNIHPIFVSHKIKWSCAISNPDGHVSELRCALPIHILAYSLLEEVRTNTSATRNLLFGGSGEEQRQQVDLPSYSDHVYDRVANASVGPTASYVPSGTRTPNTVTPPVSRGPSRPGSPVRGLASNGSSRRGSGIHLNNGDSPDHYLSGDDIPERRELPNWADSELLMSLGTLSMNANGSSESSPLHSPTGSRTPSRPSSRMGLRSGRSSGGNSRSTSRASSPERPPSIATIQGTGAGGSSTPGQAPNQNSPHPPPPPERRGSHVGSLFHVPSSLKPLTSLKNAAHRRDGTSSLGSPNIPGQSFNGHNQFTSSSLPRASFSLSSHSGFTSLAQASRDQQQNTSQGLRGSRTPPAGSSRPQSYIAPISQVPSYDIAARGFLGGGVVPISSGPPTYYDSEVLERTRSETALHEMGRQAEEATNATRLAGMLQELQAQAQTQTQAEGGADAATERGESRNPPDGPGAEGSRAS